MIRQSELRILLVEDNPDHATLAKGAILKSKVRNYVVDLCGSAEEAIEKLNANGYHMVISDYNLPGKNGFEFLEWLNEQGKKMPFMMMTGVGDEKLAVKAMQHGAYNYIVKDDVYLDVLPHVVDETFIEFFADQERARYEHEIREKNVQLEKANRELKQLDRLKSDFMASVNHDLRSPLNSIQESIAMILEGVVDTQTDKGKKVLEIAKRSIERLTQMVNDLLDFSKLERGKMNLHMAEADLDALIDETLASLKSLADRKKVQFQFKPNPEIPKVECDGDRVLQVLVNLVGNAVKFTPEGGTITVKTEMENTGQVKVTVSDTGIGIAQENLTRIFGRFDQVEGADSGGIKGTGLGLAICKELVKLHQGNIWVESKLGAGSHFIVLLPIHQAQKVVDMTRTEKGKAA
ncbi:MAG: hypothetical protein A3J52_01640 [Omnitrophica bacterium RIFCSPHIGHO2_02_FULL_49_9]|nr:MAG: hypothetical protein A3J52_01640 [Omnitrophica bacterium RIFCSPHIGHO2_02_FULL_49_9]OGW90071.1 MAG: hypothetical protein A3A73_03470 [Omnitrophica bacterium RIFCSPLOWO2_01_FULL_50_24]